MRNKVSDIHISFLSHTSHPFAVWIQLCFGNTGSDGSAFAWLVPRCMFRFNWFLLWWGSLLGFQCVQQMNSPECACKCILRWCFHDTCCCIAKMLLADSCENPQSDQLIVKLHKCLKKWPIHAFLSNSRVLWPVLSIRLLEVSMSVSTHDSNGLCWIPVLQQILTLVSKRHTKPVCSSLFHRTGPGGPASQNIFLFHS